MAKNTIQKILLCVTTSLVMFISGCEMVTEQNSEQSLKIFPTKIQLRVEVPIRAITQAVWILTT